MRSILTRKKAQLGIGDAPGVVLIILFLFLIIGTSAFVLEKYQGAFGSDKSASAINETLTTVTETGELVSGGNACNFEDFTVTYITNSTGGETIESTDYTLGTDGLVKAVVTTDYNNSDWNISYSYNFAGIACNVTGDLTEEIEDNTSIAGMVLTISLIGIVLSILIGLFYVFKRREEGL